MYRPESYQHMSRATAYRVAKELREMTGLRCIVIKAPVENRHWVMVKGTHADHVMQSEAFAKGYIYRHFGLTA